MRTEVLINKILPFILNLRDECVLYPIKNKDGYGDIQYKNSEGKKRHYLAHRLAYEVYNDVNLTSEQLILHSCDVPNCINPRHLKVGTHQDNVQDKVNKNRQAKGENNGRYVNGFNSIYSPKEKPKTEFKELFNRSLTKEQVIKLKTAIRNRGRKSLIKLSVELGVNYQTLRDLSCGRIYVDV